METREIAIGQLQPHPLNSNAMPPERFEALVGHLGRTGRYPPVIVRPLPGPAEQAGYQVLDGHHRVAALRRLGRASVHCSVWEVDDAEALLLLATLNRLEGSDDPRKRGGLLAALREARGGGEAAMRELSLQLPDGAARLERLIALTQPPPPPRPAVELAEAPVAVHFFLASADARELADRLRVLGGRREAALMALVRRPS